jgi:putative hemolysin
VIVLSGILLGIAFCAAFASYTLRDFSRSRLEEICCRRNDVDRFGIILKRHEQALLVTDVTLILSLIALVTVCLNTFDLGHLPAPYHDGEGTIVVVSTGEWLVFVTKWIAVIGGAILLLLLLPWTLSRVCGERFLFGIWPILGGMLTVLKPYLSFGGKIDRVAHRLAGIPENQDAELTTLTEEIRSVVDEGQREGVLEHEAGDMIQRVMELQEEDVAAIMTPRTDMFTLQVDLSLDEARRRIVEAGHSRVPVIGESPDDIVGVLYARDMLKYSDFNGSAPPLRDIVREPYYVPETKGIADLLETMKRKHVQLAIVVDEYSGVSGLVTMEDVLEEIVGEIADEYDKAAEEQIRTDGSGHTEVDARVHIDDLNERFDLDLPEDGDFDTVGGFALSEFGRIPIQGESFHWRHWRFTVLDADERRLSRISIDTDPNFTPAPHDS